MHQSAVDGISGRSLSGRYVFENRDTKNTRIFFEYRGLHWPGNAPLWRSSAVTRIDARECPWIKRDAVFAEYTPLSSNAEIVRRFGPGLFRPIFVPMCGKFTQMMSWREVRDLSDLVGRAGPDPFDEVVIGTPTRLCRVIHLDSAGTRTNSAM